MCCSWNGKKTHEDCVSIGKIRSVQKLYANAMISLHETGQPNQPHKLIFSSGKELVCEVADKQVK
jgi:hypothetical protein